MGQAKLKHRRVKHCVSVLLSRCAHLAPLLPPHLTAVVAADGVTYERDVIEFLLYRQALLLCCCVVLPQHSWWAHRAECLCIPAEPASVAVAVSTCCVADACALLLAVFWLSSSSMLHPLPAGRTLRCPPCCAACAWSTTCWPPTPPCCAPWGRWRRCWPPWQRRSERTRRWAAWLRRWAARLRRWAAWLPNAGSVAALPGKTAAPSPLRGRGAVVTAAP